MSAGGHAIPRTEHGRVHPCEEFPQELTLFVDGELGDVERVEIETHLETCERCRTVVSEELALRDCVRRAAPAIAAPSGLKDRIRLALDAEDDTVPEPGATTDAGTPAPRPTLRRRATAWARRRLPVAAVGATALSVSAWMWFGGSATNDVLKDIVARHSRRQPLEFQSDDPRSVEQWLSDKVDFRVKVPRIKGAPLNLVGARLSHVRDQQAVYMLFGTPQSPPRHVSMVVFDDPSQKLPVTGEPRKVEDRDVYVANSHGYNVAVWKQNEVVYSLVSDGDEDVVELVRAAQLK